MNLTTQVVLFVISKMSQLANTRELLTSEKSGRARSVVDEVESVARNLWQQTQNDDAEMAERMGFLKGKPVINTSCV